MTITTTWLHAAQPIAPETVIDALRPQGAVATTPGPTLRRQFFDSVDWRLFKAGFALSEEAGAGGPALVLSDLSGGEAVRAQGAIGEGFLSDLPETVATPLRPVLKVRRLLPRLSETVATQAVTLRNEDEKLILRAQLLALRGNGADGAFAVTLLGLSPLRGYEKAARRAAGALGAAGFAAGGGDLGQRFAAVGHAPGAYSRKIRLDLAPGATAAEAARALHLSLLDSIDRNVEGAAARIDTGFLHELRVAVRRTRSALDLVDPGVLPAAVTAPARAEFRWLGRATNEMRDLDVYLLALPGFRAGLPERLRPALDPYEAHLTKAAATAARRLARTLRSARFLALQRDWRAALESPAPGDAPHADAPARRLADDRISAAFTKFVKKGRKIDPDSPAERLHALRAHGKRLRYLLEFFRSLYPPEALGALIDDLKGLQDHLGAFQDATVQSDAILDHAATMGPATAPETLLAMGMVAEALAARQHAARAGFHAAFGPFAAGAPTIRALFPHRLEAGPARAHA